MKLSRPTNLEELRHSCNRNMPNRRFIAGGTDLVMYLREHPNDMSCLVDLSGVKELKELTLNTSFLSIGAGVTFDDLEKSSLVQTHARALALGASQVGSPQIRHRGTLGGNLANGSVAADGIPPLVALDALGVVEHPGGKEEILSIPSLIERRKKLFTPGSPVFIRAFRIPLVQGAYSDFAKVGSRRGVTISKLNLALACSLHGKNLKNLRIYAGCLGEQPLRCNEAESILNSSNQDFENFLESFSRLVEKAIPGRKSMPYKRIALQGLAADIWHGLKEVRR